MTVGSVGVLMDGGDDEGGVLLLSRPEQSSMLLLFLSCSFFLGSVPTFAACSRIGWKWVRSAA